MAKGSKSAARAVSVGELWSLGTFLGWARSSWAWRAAEKQEPSCEEAAMASCAAPKLMGILAVCCDGNGSFVHLVALVLLGHVGHQLEQPEHQALLLQLETLHFYFGGKWASLFFGEEAAGGSAASQLAAGL